MSQNTSLLTAGDQNLNAFLIAYTIHIAAVCLSGSFFLVRGIWMIQENTLLEKKIVRIAPHIIDTVLLTAGVMLSVLVQQYPGIDSWLTVKILALIAYIVFGVFALLALGRSLKLGPRFHPHRRCAQSWRLRRIRQ